MKLNFLMKYLIKIKDKKIDGVERSCIYKVLSVAYY